MKEIIVIKCGGKFVKQRVYFIPLLEAISDLFTAGISVVFVHGGGIQADEMQMKLGIPIKKINGKRITDTQSLQVVKMVYKGLVNLDIVTECIKLQISAVGISGVDGSIVIAKKRPIVNVLNYKTNTASDVDFGYVGDISSVNPKLLSNHLDDKYLPVVACLGTSRSGEILNINADSLASHIALAIHAKKLFYVTDVQGVFGKNYEGDYIHHLSLMKAQELMQSGIISDGMIPKIENVEKALYGGVETVIVGELDTKKKWLDTLLENKYGTVITKN